MRDDLPSDKPWTNESAVLNLDDKKGPGTHWVCYVKSGSRVKYFDPFGDLRPPAELIKYLGRECKIVYNTERFQNYGSYNCGHLCLRFLYS